MSRGFISSKMLFFLSMCFFSRFKFYTIFSVVKPQGSALSESRVLKVCMFVYVLIFTVPKQIVDGDFGFSFMLIWNIIGIIFTSIKYK